MVQIIVIHVHGVVKQMRNNRFDHTAPLNRQMGTGQKTCIPGSIIVWCPLKHVVIEVMAGSTGDHSVRVQ